MITESNIQPGDIKTNPGYENILNAVPVLISYIDKDLYYRYANNAYHRWFGHDPDTLPGQKLNDVMGAQAFEKIKDYLQKALSGHTVNFEIELVYPSGIKYVDATYIPDPDENGNIKGITAHVNDITQKKKIEKELAYKKDELQDYLDNASIGLHWVDGNGTIIWANNADLQLLGYQPEEYIGRNISEFHDDKGALENVLKKLHNNEKIEKFEAVMLCKDGTKKNVLINSSVLWENGKLVHSRCFTVDITEKRKAEELLAKANEELEYKVKQRTKTLLEKKEELRRSEERYYKMINEVEDYAITLLDKNGFILNWNNGAKKLKGYNSKEISGKNYSVFFTEEDQNNNLPVRFLNEAVKTGKATYEGWRVKKDKSLFRANTILTALHDKENNIIGFSSVTRDLTDAKKAEDKLKKYAAQLEIKNKELEQFAYVVSHDLQEPLRKIHTFSKLIISKEEKNLTLKGKDYLTRSASAAARMSQLIDDLLNYSRTTTYEKIFKHSDLNTLVEEVISSIVDKTSKVNINVSKLLSLYVIPFQFKQLINNLINNSIKYADPDRKLKIKIASEIVSGSNIKEAHLNSMKKYCKLTLADNGIGFDPQYSELIFDIFQRLHGKNDYPGTGIGLAICKKIVQNHDGVITARGKPGEGAEFYIYLPIE